MKTIKQIISTTFKELRPPVFSSKRTQEVSLQNNTILDAFNINLGEALESQQGSPLDYGSELWDTTGISKLIHHHEDRDKIIDIIQKYSQYQLSPIEEATRKSNLSAMILRRNHKSAKTKLNAAVLEKSMVKEVKHGWDLPLTIDLVCHINNVGAVLLGLAEHFLVNYNREKYTKMCVTHDCSFTGPSGLLVNNRVLKATTQPCFY